MRLHHTLALAALLVYAPAGLGEEWQSLPDIEAAVETFVKAQAASQPGERSVAVSRIDARLKLPKCAKLELSLPPGNRLWGNSSVGVRCPAPSAWSISVPVQIRVSNNVLVAARPLAASQTVSSEDVQLQWRDVTLFAGSALTAPDQALGRTVTAPVAAGTPLRAEMLREAKIIRYGQTVQLVAQGRGFRVTSEATAMGNASEGQLVSVKTRSGQVVKGIAKAGGVVEVAF